VIDLELLRVALIVAAAPEFEAVLDRFVLHRLPHFRTAFKFDHALLDPSSGGNEYIREKT
jgi:hypothetical protein